MKILYDSQIFDMQESGGISRYFVEILKNLPDDCKYILKTSYSDNIYLKEDKIVSLQNNIIKKKMDTFFPDINFKGKYKLKILRNRLLYKDFKTNRENDVIALQKQDFDIFHPTYYDPYFLDFIGSKPFVLTIHDMIHEIYPEMLNDVNLIRNKKLLAQKAEHIIAISENTKNDIIELLGIPEKKISVVYHGTASFSANIIDKTINLYGKYFLFTGTRRNYKNFYFILLSISDFLRNNSDVKILCTSSDFNDYEKSLISYLGLEKQIIHTYFETNDQMYRLYKDAIGFIFPSYYEGFGIPILESFEAGCPCILADASCFREIAGDAALYFEPKNKKQLNDCLEQLLKNTQLRNDLITKGKERLSNFSWDKTAIQTANIYKKILSNI